jgi:hypothetical protein
MGYDLVPKNKAVKGISFGAFWWPIMLQETGMGYVLGYGAGRTPASYVYIPDKRGASPVSNDGYSVSSKEASMMAAIARGFVSVNRFIQKEWDVIPEDQKTTDWEYKTHEGKLLYNRPWHEDRLKQIEAFADFAEKSKGFKID